MTCMKVQNEFIMFLNMLSLRSCKCSPLPSWTKWSLSAMLNTLRSHFLVVFGWVLQGRKNHTYLYKLFLTVLQNVWRNKNIFKQKDTPFKEFKKRVVDNNIYALMSAGTVSIKIASVMSL
jgi:hypothetical protein